MFRLRKLMPLLVTVILAGLIILPMWAADTEKDNAAANEIATLEQLKAAFENGGSYKITKDIVSDTYIEGYKDITLDLNGHTLSRENITATEGGNKDRYFILQRDRILTLNNSIEKTGHIKAFAKQGANNAAPRAVGANAKDPDETHPNGYHPKVVVNEGVKIVAYGNGNEATTVHAVSVCTNYLKKSDKVVSTASAEINGGIFRTYDINVGSNVINGKVIALEGYGASAVINNISLSANGCSAVTVCAGANLTINDGRISTYDYSGSGLRVHNAFLTINGGTFDFNGFVCRNSVDFDEYPEAYDNGNIRINGGVFSGDTPRSDGNANVEIYGGTFNFNPQNHDSYSEEHFNGLVVGSAIVTREGNKHVVKNTEKVITTFDELKLIEKGGTFKLGANIVIPQDSNRISTSRDVRLDLNGHTIAKTVSSDGNPRRILRTFDNTLRIRNSSNNEGTISLNIINDAVKGLALDAYALETGAHPKLSIDGKVKIKISGGDIKSYAVLAFTDRGDDSPIDNPNLIDRTAEVTLNNGVNIISSGRGVLSEGYGASMTINGGIVESDRYTAVSNDMGAQLTINGGTFTSALRSTVVNCKATAIINGGTFETKNAERYVLYNDADVDKYYSAQADTTMIVKGGVFTGNIENYVDPTQGIATLAISGGKYTVDPTEWLAEGCTVVKEGGYFVVGGGSGPSKPILPEDVPEDIEKDPAVDAPSEEDVIKTVPVFAESLEVKGDGMAYVQAGAAKEMVAKGLTSEKVEAVTPLPIFKAAISEAGKVVAVSVNMKGEELLPTADTVEDMKLFKLTGDKSFEYKRISSAAEAKDGTFMLLKAFGEAATGAIDKNTTYQLVMFIKDNGKYDLDETEKVVLDPAALVKTSSDKPSPSGSGGGGGCNAGFGIFALLCAVPMIFRKKQ